MRRYRFEQRGLVDRMGVSLLPLIHERGSLRALDAVPWTSHRAIALQLPCSLVAAWGVWSLFSTRLTPSTAPAARTSSSISRSLSSRPRR
jgi:hypothetical protein